MGEMTDFEVREIQKMLVRLGLAEDLDDAAFSMADAGEIGSMQLTAILSDEGRERLSRGDIPSYEPLEDDEGRGILGE
jgi:hypothetical protein